ncbi:MAG: flavodoxin family protein [Endomicrobia bacterium]|nr:flavodoxin family protein [Endomicrobiia bacterium]MDW8055579.1 flavodoxin family protein [Elusimicrobiota bacterium]
MNLLLLNVSPNRQGSSSELTKKIYNCLHKKINLQVVNLHKFKISPCAGCYNYCYKYGKCKLYDDMQILYNEFEHCDGLIFVTPVYFYHIPGYAKVMIDRCQPYWVRKYVLKNLTLPNRFGSVICIGATKGEKLFTGINLTMKYFFDIFNFNFFVDDNLYLRRIENKKDLVKHKTEIESYINRIRIKLTEP